MEINVLRLLFVAVALTTAPAVADPFPSQKSATSPNIAYHYTATTTGGTGIVSFNVPKPPNGNYYASFSANFKPLGMLKAPETFTCIITTNTSNVDIAQSTVNSSSSSGFSIGLNGGSTLGVKAGTKVFVSCGTQDFVDWMWGDKPLSVTLISLDSQVNGNLQPH